MKKFILSLSLIFLTLFTYGQVNYCDSIEINITSQTSTSVSFGSNVPSLNIPGSISYDWTLADESGTIINSSVATNTIFSLPNPMNSDTNYICLTNVLSNPVLTIACNTCDTIVWNGTNWMLLSMIPPPCNLTGGSVYVDPTSVPWMMNATVNGMSQYTYVWSNGGSANQTPFYSGWCVTIVDLATGCDTTICEGCIPDTMAVCACPMTYIPVCGCDGNMYSNDCIAICAGIYSFTPAIPSGIPGGFLPCNTQQPCIVEINNGTVDIEICDGDTAILEATTGFDTYLWTTLSSPGVTLGTTHIIEVTDPGLYIVIVTDSTNCVDMDSIEVIVYPLTPLNLMTAPNPPEVCVGDSVIIEVNPNFVNYWWNTGNPLDQDEDRVVVYPTQDFTYVVEALDSNGCESREEILVLVDTCATCEVEIDGDSIICNWGNPQILIASPTSLSNPFVTYLWSTGQIGPVLTITTPGTYCVTATDSTGCTDTECFTVTVQDIPIYSEPSPPIICLGDSIVLEIDTIGLSNITWVPNTLITPPVHRIVDFPIFSQTYVVEAIDSAGCERRGEIFVVVDTCSTSGIYSEMFSKINIYPNPTSDKLYINLPKNEIFTISVLSMEGKLILQEIEALNSIVIASEKLTKGSYILKIENDKGIFSRIVIFE